MSIKPKRRTILVCSCVIAIACAALVYMVARERPRRIDSFLFPDDSLRAYVSEKVDTDGDGLLSSDEAATLRVLVIDDVQQLSGLDAFPNLATVVARGDSLRVVNITDVPSLSRLDLAGASNLSEVTIDNALSLKTIDLRGTSVASLDLSKAGHVSQVLADPTTQVTGVGDANVRQELLPTRFVGKNSGTSEYEVGDLTVQAEYDDEGRITSRFLSGEVSARLDYSYGEDGRLSSVTVGDAPEDIDERWSLRYGEGTIEATGDSGSYVNRRYDQRGRLSSVALDTRGVGGPIQCAISLEYDARGFLDRLVMDEGGSQTTYDISCNGAGMVEAVSTDGGPAVFLAYSGDTISVQGSLGQESSAVGRLTSDGQYYGSLTRDADGNAARIVGRCGTYSQDQAEDGSEHIWGKLATPDGSVQYAYDVDCECYDIPADVSTPTPAVSTYDKANPTPYVDYWLLDDTETAVRVAIQEAVDGQWALGSTDPVVAEVHDPDSLSQYSSSLDQIAGGLKVDAQDLRYALVDFGLTDDPLLLVADAKSQDCLAGIYGLSAGKVTQVRRPEDGSKMLLCGGGFLRIIDADGGESVEHFSGASFDEVAYVRDGAYRNLLSEEDTSDDGAAASLLESAYPSAMASISWESAQ